MEKPEAVQIPTIEDFYKAYFDPVTRQRIKKQLAEMKRKTAIVEEQLRILRKSNTA